MPVEYHKEYNERYYARAEIKAHRANSARERRNNADQAEMQKINARLAVRNALRRGEIVRGACEECGELKSEAHHDDYSKPLSVRWLCRRHHQEFHLSAKATGQSIDEVVKGV
jgi:hypothetical protein